MAERWVQPELPMLAPEAPEQCGRTVGGRPGLLGADVLRQLPVSAWDDVTTVYLPPPERLAELLAGVGRG